MEKRKETGLLGMDWVGKRRESREEVGVGRKEGKPDWRLVDV